MRNLLLEALITRRSGNAEFFRLARHEEISRRGPASSVLPLTGKTGQRGSNGITRGFFFFLISALVMGASHSGLAADGNFTVGNWSVRVDASPQNGGKTAILMHLSGENNFSITCAKGEMDVIINVKEYMGSVNSTMRYSLDGGPVAEWGVSSASSGQVLFVEKPFEFVQSLFDHKQLAVAVMPYRQEEIEAAFDITDIQEAFAPIRKFCEASGKR